MSLKLHLVNGSRLPNIAKCHIIIVKIEKLIQEYISNILDQRIIIKIPIN